MTFKRGKMWYLDYSDETGKRHREPWSTSQEAANTEEKKRKQIVLLLRGNAGQFGQMRWEDFKILLENSFYPKRKPKTVVHYKQVIKWVDEYIAPQKLLDVTPNKVELMRLKLLECGHGKHNVERGIRACFAIFTWAWKNNLLHEKIQWKAVENTHLKRKNPVFLTLPEFKFVLEELNPKNTKPKYKITHNAQIYLFALMCGRMIMRPSEAWFARWELADLENGEYKLLDEEEAGFDVKVESYRTIPIPTHLLAYLRQIKKTAKSPYIIEWEKGYNNKKLTDGRPMKAQCFFKHVSAALTTLGFKEATAYSFRHTGATNLVVKMKETLSTTGKIMGHKDEKTTSIYVHPVTDDMREAVEKLESMEYASAPTTSACNLQNCHKCAKKEVLTRALILAAKILQITK